MSDKPKRVLSPEHLEKLKLAREKALEAKHKLGTIRRAQRDDEREQIDKKYQEVMAKKGSKVVEAKTQDEDEVEEVKPSKSKKAPPKKKVVKKVIEVSDSSDDDESESSEEESEPEVEYVVRRTKKGGKVAHKPVKEYDTPKLSAEVARNMLRDRVMNEAQTSAFKSLFPYHNF
jgi:hypothetical protein